MSGFEALSIACSIMQVISFTKEVLTLCKDVYDGRATADGRMQENTTSIKTLLDEMNGRSGSIQQQTKDEKELHEIAQKCSKAAQELQKEIQQVTKYHKRGDSMRAIIAGYKSKTHKRKIAGLYDQFCQYQKTLETHLLVRLCTKTDAIELQRREGFTELSETMKHFVSQIAAGHTEMANLIARDGTHTRQQIQQSEARVKQSINDVSAEADYEAKRSRILRSLKYESMNTRRTELKPAHEATYISIFESLEVDKEPTSGSAAAWKDFVKWLQSNKRVFWIQGKPGAGKSTLVKFLLQHENTQKGVDKWSPNTLIVSHFFWKPGDMLQKNFRGLLCSLNHQLLSSEHNLVGYVLSEFMFAGDKDTIGDWEIPELESIFHSILLQCKRSVLFLIDGLDEATETEEVLKFLDSLIELRNTKLCISSRGEDIYGQKFSKYEGLKLNELTKYDMHQFALAGLPEPDDRYPSDFLEHLIHLLVSKAEGVYLWLVIALESVKRGLRNNDDQHEILLRLSKLPSKLEELYADMWNRLGEDKEIYQKEAARYISLLIMNQSLRERYQSYYAECDWPLSPFQLMLTTNEKMKENMLDKSYRLPVSEISRKCADVTKGISIKTAGLLVTQYDPNGYYFEMETKPNFSQLNKHLTSKVDFIHRTLFDFFKEAEVGKNILAQSQTNPTDVELATTILCQLRTTQYSSKKIQWRIRLTHGTPLHYYCWILGQISAQDSVSKSKMNITLLHAFESLFEAGLLPWDYRPEWHPHPCIDVLLISYPAFKWFIHSRVLSKGASHATCLLREFMLARAFDVSWPESNLDSKEYIQSLGGDINSTDICLYTSPISTVTRISHSPALGYHPSRTPEFATYESILSAVIKRLYYDAIYWGILPYASMQNLIAVLERTPNLNKRTSFLLATTYYRGHPNKFHKLDDLLFTLASTRGEDEQLTLHINRMNTKNYFAFVIAEVNLKHLVEHILKVVLSGPEDTMSLITRARQLTEIDKSKPHIKARFFIEGRFDARSAFDPMACYRFINQDIDILADNADREHAYGQFPRYRITPEKINDYLEQCERVDLSALSVLADEKLGICRLKDMGIKPPS